MRRRPLKRAAPLSLALALTGIPGVWAARAPVVSVGGFSSQISPGSAVAGGSITTRSGSVAGSASAGPANTPAPSAPVPPPPPTLPSDSPLLADAHPVGTGSLWYAGPSGEQCIYAPSASPVCFVIVAPAAASLDVAALAASLEGELALSPAPIVASPATGRDGLTGAPSWFWLAPAPLTKLLSLSLDGESFTLTATPGDVEWSFGDGAPLEAGPGVAFSPGAVPPGAVTHVYSTRCLPGDRPSGSGTDPALALGCGPDGYEVSAVLSWDIAYVATGSENESGQLPSRTTGSWLVYPVNEVRAFLTGGEG